jgi:hypothetical protein
MTNNIPQLLGVETKLRRLISEYNIATRDGTLKQMANRLMEIKTIAQQAEYVCTDLIFPPQVFTPPPEEDE